MKKLLITAIFLIFVHYVCPQGIQQPTSMLLYSNHLTIQQHGDQTTLSFTCKSRVGACSFKYLLLPQDWHSKGNNLIFPTMYLNSIRSFLIRANISEPTGESMIRDILIDFSEGPQMTSTLIKSIVGAQMIDDPILNNSSSSKETASVIPVNQFGETFLEANGIIPMLPSIGKIDSVIVGSDPVRISSIIQDILSFKQPCEQKTKYLNETVSRIQEHINFNQNLMKVEQQNQMMKQEGLKNLEAEKNKINSQITLLTDKDKIKQELSRLEGEKQISFNKYYSYQIIAIKYQQKINQMTVSDVVNSSQLVQLQSQMQRDKQQIEQINSEMKKLTDRKAELEQKLRENQKKISSTLGTPAEYADQKKLSQLQATLAQYNSLSQKYKVQYENTESQLALLKDKLEMLDNTLARLKVRLLEVQIQIQNHKQAHMPEEMRNIKSRLEVLQRGVPKLKNQLEDCRKELGIKIPTKDEPKTNIKDQLNTNGVEPDQEVAKLQQLKPSFNITDLRSKNRNSNAVNIFSSKWIMNYGVPKTYLFACSSNSVVDRYGKIVQVVSAAIRVKDYLGNTYIIHIGSCTRITGPSSSFTPKIGDVIDWNGYQMVEGIYNALRVNFYVLG